MSRAGWIAVVVLVGLAGAIWLARRSPSLSPEARIRARFDEAARAAEKRRADEVVEILSERFGGGGEGMRADRDEVRRMLALELLRGQWVSVSVTSARTIVDGSRARSNVDVLMSRSEDRRKGIAALLPGEAAAHRFELELEEEKGEWRVVSGTWRQIGLAEAVAGPELPSW